MKKSVILFVTVLATLSGQMGKAQSTATLIWSQDFGSLADGTAITTANVPANTGTGSTKGLTSVGGTLTATSGQFSGASALLSGASSGFQWVNGSDSGNSTFKTGVLDFSVFSSSTLSAFQVFLGSGPSFEGTSGLAGMANSDVTAGFQFTGGQLQTRSSTANNTFANVGSVGFAGNTAYNFSIVFNDAATNFSYAAGAGYLAGSVASQTADIYVNGTLLDDNVTIAGGGTGSVGNVGGVRFETTAATPSVIVDNSQLYKLTGAAVPTPEPSAVALATLGGIACFFIARRRR
jgi:hypothetical protein